MTRPGLMDVVTGENAIGGPPPQQLGSEQRDDHQHVQQKRASTRYWAEQPCQEETLRLPERVTCGPPIRHGPPPACEVYESQAPEIPPVLELEAQARCRAGSEG